ncbi:branched-chain amino acid ABC transporter permease [Aquisalimonas lutea]|uniref:branched-chain amino acid ABC transporter permease n=1 Tax=Aquisalimonas lutea TaxID=1327750 RepID=UPI0025B3ADB8|nr:branched-chain amino acid ABC transporter permease [Aquisalimonas lutea]MDN3518103.1 branched-chain amino acid ABC transporter permease [Aquisalimonas lutea]
MGEFLQYLVTGITIGSTFALVALGFCLVYNASGIINFAQGDFVMVGGMSAVFIMASGVPMGLALFLAVVVGGLAGVLLYKGGIQPATNAEPIQLIIITVGAALFLRGVAQVVWGTGYFSLPTFTGDEPIRFLGVVMVPQSFWVIGVTVAIVAALGLFFTRTRLGKAVLATSYNRDAATLMGIDTSMVLLLSFGLAGALGAVAGVIVAPITFAHYEMGIMFGLKGFVAAVLGGLGSFVGAVAGALILGITEAMMAGYISSDYKDAVAFVLILLILFFMPSGLFGRRGVERV